MVNLTQSAAECMPNRTVPSTAIDSHYFIEVTEHLHQYKRSFANVALFDLLASKLTAFLDLVYFLLLFDGRRGEILTNEFFCPYPSILCTIGH